MFISTEDWANYIKKLSAIDSKAAELVKAWVQKNGFGDRKALIDYAYAVATAYGEASGALAAAMYDATAEVEGKFFEPAEPAPTPEYGEVAKAVNGTLKQSENVDLVANSVSRLVKRTGADTMLKNAGRDGAQFAWVPSGDTCAFCITLASRGWQYISKNSLKNGHAEHIHANCDCTYAIRHSKDMGVQGYDPDEYKAMYDNASNGTPKDKINAMRRALYEKNKEQINGQKRMAYSRKQTANIMRQENLTAKPPEEFKHNFDDFETLELNSDEQKVFESLLNATRENGYEYGYIVDDGIIGEIRTSEEKSKVFLPDADIKGFHTDLMHSHTGETPPSAVDLRRLVNERIDRIGVVTYNGDVFIVDARSGWRPSAIEFDDAERIIRESVDIDMMEQGYLKGWNPDELTYMCIREEFYQICRQYGWTMKAGRL